MTEVTSGLDPARWRIVTSDGETLFGTSHIGQEQALRDGLPTALAAALLAGLATLTARRFVAASALAALATVLAGAAIAPLGQPAITSLAMLAAVAAPAIWLFSWGTRRRWLRLLVILALGAVTAAWLAGRFVLPAVYDLAELGRQGVMAGGAFAMLVRVGDWRRWRRRLLLLDSRRAADVIALAAVVMLSIFLVLALDLPLPVVLGLLALVVIAYPRFRHPIAEAVDRILLGDVRDRAGIEAVEEERGRIARDLHDAPLQEIAAVIRRLDQRDDASHETEILRGVATHIRRITTELRPPILDDLGLAAAIAYAVDQGIERAPDLEVNVEIGPPDTLEDRPPADVELAAYRIVSEAVNNAVAHARATTLTVRAFIAGDLVDLTVADDGAGISQSAARDAARRGRFGLVSMEQRAALINAEFTIEDNEPQGTRVRLTWTQAK